MRNAVRFFFIAAALALMSTQALQAQQRNSISGFVFDDSRRPASGLYVELLDEVYMAVGRTRTGGSGLYRFDNLPQGRYTVKVLTHGTNLVEQSRSVSLIPLSVIAGRGVATEQVDFYLQPRKPGRQPLGAPAVVFAQDVPEQARGLYEAGVEDLAAKKDAAGLEKIKRAIEVFPDYFLALDRLGNEYLARGHYEAAFVLLDRSATINPKSFTSIVGVGVSLYRLEQIDRAIDKFRAGIGLDRTSGFPHMWLGIALHRKGKPKEALASLVKANELHQEKSPEVHFQLARVFKDLNEFAKAADSLEKYLKLRPDAENAGEVRNAIALLRAKR